MKKVVIIGTHGVPANYGGFETLTENLIEKKSSKDVQYTVFCSARVYKQRLNSYKNAQLVYVPCFNPFGVQSVPYDILSLIMTLWRYDVVLILGTPGCTFLPLYKLLCRARLIVNIDGLEHRRDKWGRFAKKVWLVSEKIAVNYADTVVVDNKAIQKYVSDEYGQSSVLITYGADHVLRNIPMSRQSDILQSYSLEARKYHCALCRIEPENNCHEILKAFEKSEERLVFIGNWDKSSYGQELYKKYLDKANITLLKAVYDHDILYTLRGNCKSYIHGHSAGGTNPSLVEAMIQGLSIIAFDCVFNRYTTDNDANYFSNAEELTCLISGQFGNNNGDKMRQIAEKEYSWSKIVGQYEALYE